MFKRPAVMFAIAFAGGIAFEKKGIFPLLIFTALLFAGQMVYLKKLYRERQGISISDRLLFLAPVFLVLGFACMHLARAGYEKRAGNYARCLDAGKDVAVSGTVRKLSITKNGYSFELYRAKAKVYGDGGGIEQDVGTLFIYYDCPVDAALSVKEGQKVFVYGRGYCYREAQNPGQFDAKSYYFSKNITGAVNALRIDVSTSSYHCLNQALFLAKKRILQSFSDYLGSGAGVVSSMLLGERAFLPEETKELYRRGGISHILAISGLHVSLFGAAVYSLLRKSILGRNGAIPAACVCVLVYGRFVNAQISTGRAVLMFLLMLLATVLGRTYDTLSAMSISLIVLLARSPGALFTAAFQLSYAAAYGASVFAGVLGEGAKERGREKEKRKQIRFFEALRFGMAITLITLPLVAVHFFEVPLYGIFLNPVVVPLLSVLLFCALLSGVLGIVFLSAGVFFSGTVKAVLWLYELLCRGVSALPFSMLLFGKPKLWQVALYYVLLCAGVILWRREQGRKRELFLRTGETKGFRLRGYHLIFVLLPLCLLPVPQTGLTVSFLSVGQGDGIVLESRESVLSDRRVILIDGGSSDVSKLGEQRLVPFLKSKGIRRIDCAFVSHTDEDHISGLKELLEQAGEIVIKMLVLPELSVPDAEYLSLLELAKQKGVEVFFLAAGDTLKIGKDLKFFCLSPEKTGSYADKNSASMVLLAEYGEFDLLLSGDTTKEAEAAIIRRWEKTPELCGRTVEVLKVAHHGSATSTSEAFLTALPPQVAVISCGSGNRYGHPHKEILERLEETGAMVVRTDLSGAVTVRVKDNRVRMKEFFR